MLHPPVTSWEEVPGYLLDLAHRDLSTGPDPLPSVVAFAGEDPLAVGVLRPFDQGGPVPALVELLALLLPLGVDRLGLTLSGRAWSFDDPVPPVCEEGDLRQQVLLLVLADASSGPCTVHAELRAIEPADQAAAGWRLSAPLVADEVTDGVAEAPLAHALRVLLDHRGELEEETDDRALVGQLGRILLLGHALALAPEPTERLVRSSAA
ncbi:MAG: hypothetical protein ACLFUG_08665 [Nitriliruptoraceae bacterium]